MGQLGAGHDADKFGDRDQKGHVQDCAVVLIGVCEACCEKQAQENAH